MKAPAYDLTHAHNAKGQWAYQHLLSVNGKFDDITRADLLAEADRFGVRRPEELLSDVRAALDNWGSTPNKQVSARANRTNLLGIFYFCEFGWSCGMNWSTGMNLNRTLLLFFPVVV